MNGALQVRVVLHASLFHRDGLRWAVDPASAAKALLMPGLDGVGRSSQVGALFLCMGGKIELDPESSWACCCF